MKLRDRFRRRVQRMTIPEDKRCTAAPGCTNEAVCIEGSMVPPYTETRRCIEHPPNSLVDAVRADVRCEWCGRGFWPDCLHLDCGS